jgi:hypothetical protein
MTIDDVMSFHLEKLAARLSVTCVKWQSKVRPIPCAWEMPDSWGLPPSDIARAAYSLYNANTAQHLDDAELLSEDEDDEDDLDDGNDDELMAEVEEVAYAHEYRVGDSDSEGELEYWDEANVPSSPTSY